MKGSSNPPVTKCMKEHIVRVPSLVPVELKEQTMAWMQFVRILLRHITLIDIAQILFLVPCANNGTKQ